MVADQFTYWDWAVVAIYILLTTLVGHALRGQQSTIHDFFLAGRRLPWPAVCGSLIATEISALTFVGVPGMVYAVGGDFTYLQWGIGSLIARVLVGVYFVKAFYEKEIYSPYDFMANRLGRGIRPLTTLLFWLSSILGQSVRVLVTALILRVVTGMDFAHCIMIIGAVSILWTLMGGMTTVIWTDVMQFFLFIFGGILAFFWLIGSLDGGFWQMVELGREAVDGDEKPASKFRLLDLAYDPAVQFTLWVGILAMPFQNLAAFGADQLNAQRIFCCRTPRDASKAIIFSSVSLSITVLFLLVGAALYAYYQVNPPGPAETALMDETEDNVFPIWITTVLWPGLSGLILAGAFAAAISSLDSILAALSQTSLSLFVKDFDKAPERLLRTSRLLVIFWGLALVWFAIELDAMRGDINMVSLAFGMVSYTHGPLLGILLLAILPLGRDGRGVWVGVLLSFLVTLYIREDFYTILLNKGWMSPVNHLIWTPNHLNFAWLFPITCLITLGTGYLLGRKTGPHGEATGSASKKK